MQNTSGEEQKQNKERERGGAEIKKKTSYYNIGLNMGERMIVWKGYKEKSIECYKNANKKYE